MRVVLGFLAACAALRAHDIPRDVVVSVYLKPQGRELQMLVRVPVPAIRDVFFPERSPGLIDVRSATPMLADAAQLWLSDAVELYEAGQLLPKPVVRATRFSLDSDRAFLTWDSARAHLDAPPPGETVIANQAAMDVLFVFPIASDASRFSFDPKWARLGQRVVTTLQLVEPSGRVRRFDFLGDPGLVALTPNALQAAWRFVRLGFEHILEGTDHLLFLACLVIPIRRFWPLVGVVTAFTAAHSITLMAAGLDLAPGALWFPPLVETLIAASIVYMAIENALRDTPVARWTAAFAFGLVHGFGFSFALRENLQFTGDHLITSLLSFNLGVEAGQLAVLLLLVPALHLMFRWTGKERALTLVLTAFIAHTGWHWVLDRWERLRQFPLTPPIIDAAFLAALLKWTLLLVLVAGALVAADAFRKKRLPTRLT